MTDRQVKVTLVIDDKGSVKVMRTAGEESSRTEGKLKGLDKQVKGVGKSFGGLKGAITSGLGFLGAGSLIFGLGDIASKTKEIAEETEKFHTVTGIGAKSSLYYAQALKARGLSGETVNKAFGFLAKNLKSAELQESKFALSQTKAAAKGVLTTSVLGRQAQAFKELGINVSSFNRLNEQEKLEAVTKAFERLAPGIKKTRLERELFGRGGSQLSTVLEKNNLGLSHQLELAKRFFPTIKGGAEGMKELIEKQAESKMAWEGLEFTLGQKLIPAMTSVMGWFSKVAVEVEKGRGFWGELAKAIEGVVTFGKGVVSFLKEAAKYLGIKVGGGTVGALLLGGLGLKALAKVGGAGLLGKALGGGAAEGAAGAGLLANAPLALGVGGAAAYGAFTYHNRHTLGENLHQALAAFGLGGPPTGNLGKGLLIKTPTGNTGGKAAVGAGETAQEASLIARAIESLKPTHDEKVFQIHMDGAKIAEGLLRNPRARRQLAEAMTIYAQQMAARK